MEPPGYTSEHEEDSGIDPGHALFTHAEWLRRWQKKSRSVLYRDALAEYLERHYGNAITESINQVVDDPEAADPELDAFVAEAARRILMQVEWEE